MDSTMEVASIFENAIQANQFEWNLGLAIFAFGIFVLSWMVKNGNNFTFTETVLATLGLKKFKRTIAINIVHVLTIIIPLVLMAYAVTSYEGT